MLGCFSFPWKYTVEVLQLLNCCVLFRLSVAFGVWDLRPWQGQERSLCCPLHLSLEKERWRFVFVVQIAFDLPLCSYGDEALCLAPIQSSCKSPFAGQKGWRCSTEEEEEEEKEGGFLPISICFKSPAACLPLPSAFANMYQLIRMVFSASWCPSTS